MGVAGPSIAARFLPVWVQLCQGLRLICARDCACHPGGGAKDKVVKGAPSAPLWPSETRRVAGEPIITIKDPRLSENCSPDAEEVDWW